MRQVLELLPGLVSLQLLESHSLFINGFCYRQQHQLAMVRPVPCRPLRRAAPITKLHDGQQGSVNRQAPRQAAGRRQLPSSMTGTRAAPIAKPH